MKFLVYELSARRDPRLRCWDTCSAFLETIEVDEEDYGLSILWPALVKKGLVEGSVETVWDEWYFEKTKNGFERPWKVVLLDQADNDRPFLELHIVEEEESK